MYRLVCTSSLQLYAHPGMTALICLRSALKAICSNGDLLRDCRSERSMGELPMMDRRQSGSCSGVLPNIFQHSFDLDAASGMLTLSLVRAQDGAGMYVQPQYLLMSAFGIT